MTFGSRKKQCIADPVSVFALNWVISRRLAAIFGRHRCGAGIILIIELVCGSGNLAAEVSGHHVVPGRLVGIWVVGLAELGLVSRLGPNQVDLWKAY